MKDGAATKLVVYDLEAWANLVAAEVNARAVGAGCRWTTLAAFETLLPDIADECRLFKDCTSTIDIAAHESIAASCDVEGVRVGESDGMVVCTQHRT